MKKQSLLDQLDVNLDHVEKNLRATILYLFNLVEDQAAENKILRENNQQLRDEVNRLKGEQGKPNIKPRNSNGDTDVSSENERKRKKKKRKRYNKKSDIKIDREEKCNIDKSQLPSDAIFKGYQETIVQGLKIETDNILFRKEIYYSPSKNKTYVGTLPKGYNSGYGPEIKALVMTMKNAYNMTESKILDFLHNHHIQISAATISDMLIKKTEIFDKEKEELYRAGLESSEYQQTDDTGARVNGKNYHTHVVCNPLFTAYFTKETKSRLTILKILNLDADELTYRLDNEAITILKQLRVGKKYIAALMPLQADKDLDECCMQKLLEKTFSSKESFSALPKKVKTQILEASGISSYHKQTEIPVVEILVCDDAPQFKLLTEALMLCWIHEGRHYKKLQPVVPFNVKELDAFQIQFWKFYRQLLKYKISPSDDDAQKLFAKFDKLFSKKTGYVVLDDRIAKTRQKKEELLLVLKYPNLPLHNNASELAARVSVRKRDVSLHTVTDEGTKANDTFLSIVETCKKLSVNAYEYILDRVSNTFELPSLAHLIRTHNFGYSSAFNP